ncbi:MAG: hypothetical protein KOO62_10385 [candidate division Zixibacteria bacterium]|nr:hypothetical protein [candidate division Zixibacteria bacterium]
MLKPITILLILVLVAACMLGCDDNGTNSQGGQPKPVPGVATDIKLSIYSNGWGTLLDSMILPTEGDVVIDVYESNPYYDSAQYYIYAVADDYYTELYFCEKGEMISVDLDSVAGYPRSMTGVIFGVQGFFADSYHANKTMELHGPGRLRKSITTDEQGRYGVGDLPLGDYTCEFMCEGVSYVLDLSNGGGTDYEDLSYIEPQQAMAPNLYLYPETEAQVAVTLSFPNGGHVTESEPPYNMGWNVEVSPDGIIDDTYDYLFYEALLPCDFNTDAGWMLTTDRLELEFRTLLTNLGFVGREIDDFVTYWVPLLDDAPYYGVYPQDVNSLIDLAILPQPTSIMRQLLLIRPFNRPIAIQAPPDDGPFVREGFTAAEWGVIAPYLDHSGH